MKVRSAVLGLCTLILAFVPATAQTADPDFDKVVGKWKWENVVLEITRCAETELCAKVIKGNSKCGGKMIRSKIVKIDADNSSGSICHPNDGKIYKSKITTVDAETISMKGSSGGNIFEGTFTRLN